MFEGAISVGHAETAKYAAADDAVISPGKLSVSWAYARIDMNR
jgi:hypothetical protein